MIISADSQAETGTENSKRLDCRSMFPLFTCLHQKEHKRRRLAPNTDASEHKCKLTPKKPTKLPLKTSYITVCTHTSLSILIHA